MKLEKYSIGIGDRFGLQGVPQLRAIKLAADDGVRISPVWNKSQREHDILGTHPADTRREADGAVRELGWSGAYFVDADHITGSTVDRFVETCDFFTIDVAGFIGTSPHPDALRAFLRAMTRFSGELFLPGLGQPFHVDEAFLSAVAGRYLNAVGEAGRIYRKIVSGRKGKEFIPEVSFDESVAAQSPGELFFILGAIAAEGIPIRTIAPKFIGSFLKGVDYVGDRDAFAQDFEQDIVALAFAARTFHLPEDLKLSVHTGSDKFSLYPLMHRAIRKHNAGLHLKTAGTTWVEEVAGLAEAGGEGLRTAREIYARSFERIDELSGPYLQVVSMQRSKLPPPADVASWSAETFAAALRHDPANPEYNPHLRQLVHIGYKVAAEMGVRFTDLLRRHAGPLGAGVTRNLYQRHIAPLFLGAHETD
jgi:hypothetical protein